MRIEVSDVTHRGELSEFRDEWRALASESERTDLFQTYEWMVSWLEAFWTEGPIRCIFAHGDGKLVGALPLVWDESGFLRCRQSLTPPANAHSSGFDLLSVGDRTEVLAGIVDHMRPRMPVRLALGGVPADSPTIPAIRTLERDGHIRMISRGRSRVLFVRLQGTWREYLDALDTRTRHKLRRNERRLTEDADARFETVTRESELGRAMDDILQIERHSWKERAGSSIALEPGAEVFYRSFLGRAFRQGWGRIHLLHIFGKPAAHVLGVVYRKKYYPLKTSFDAEFSTMSPGSVLVGHAVRDAFEQGYDTFEFLGANEYFKSKLGNDSRERVDLCLFGGNAHRCMACFWSETIARPFVRTRLPFLAGLKNKLRTDS